MTDLLHRIDQYLNEIPLLHADAVSIPPFTLFLSRKSAQGFPSYARPTGPLPDDLAAVFLEVHREFAARHLEPRWEFIAELAPGLLERLQDAGFTDLQPTPVMAVTRESFTAQDVPSVEVRRVEPGGDLAPLLYAQRVAFGGDEASVVTAEDVRSFEEALQAGMRYWGAYVEGNGVAAGVQTPLHGVTEVAGIGTLPAYQRRGVGGALTTALVRDAFALGCEVVFLTAGDDRARRVYERVGFRVVGSGMTSMDPAPVTGDP